MSERNTDFLVEFPKVRVYVTAKTVKTVVRKAAKKIVRFIGTTFGAKKEVYMNFCEYTELPGTKNLWLVTAQIFVIPEEGKETTKPKEQILQSYMCETARKPNPLVM